MGGGSLPSTFRRGAAAFQRALPIRCFGLPQPTSPRPLVRASLATTGNDIRGDGSGRERRQQAASHVTLHAVRQHHPDVIIVAERCWRSQGNRLQRSFRRRRGEHVSTKHRLVSARLRDVAVTPTASVAHSLPDSSAGAVIEQFGCALVPEIVSPARARPTDSESRYFPDPSRSPNAPLDRLDPNPITFV